MRLYLVYHILNILFSVITNEPVEFWKLLVEIQDFKKMTDPSRGIFKMYLGSSKKNQSLTTWNLLDPETLGFWPIMANNLHGHCSSPRRKMERLLITRWCSVAGSRPSLKSKSSYLKLCAFASRGSLTKVWDHMWRVAIYMSTLRIFYVETSKLLKLDQWKPMVSLLS